jgi:hypothetical protein
MFDVEKIQKMEETHALAEFVILQDKRRSLQDLCDFSTKLNKKCPTTRSYVFPSYQTCQSVFETSGTLIILEKKKDRFSIKNDKQVLEVFTTRDHVKEKQMKR